MSKSKYQGNFTKEELNELESERRELHEEREERKKREMAKRKARCNRHVEWQEEE